jgi:hypothetical protein
MVLEVVQDVTVTMGNTIQKLIRDLTGLNVASTLGVASKEVLGSAGQFLGKIPLAGGIFAYVFKQVGKGIVIVTTTADNLVDDAGKIVNRVVESAKDLVVLSLETIGESVGKVQLGGKKYKKTMKKHNKKHNKKHK